MSQVTVRMREVIRTFKAKICKRFCKPLNSNNNDVFTLIYLLMKIPCLHLFVTQHSITGLGTPGTLGFPASYQNLPTWGDGSISKVFSGQAVGSELNI